MTSTRGFKRWISENDRNVSYGGTVEATVAVEVTCGQSIEEIHRAAQETGTIAEIEADKAVIAMEDYLWQYLHDQKEKP